MSAGQGTPRHARVDSLMRFASGGFALLVAATEVTAAAPAVPPPVPAGLSAVTPWYDGILFTEAPGTGRFAATTGALHPISTTVIPPLASAMVGDVLRVGYAHDAWSIRSHGSGRDYVSTVHVPLALADPGHQCVKLDEVAVPMFEVIDVAGQPVTLRETWRVVVPPDDLAIEQEVRPLGDSFASASLAVMLRITNMSAGEARLGFRLLLNPDILVSLGGTTSPFIGFRGPGATPEPLGHLEHDWASPGWREWDMYGHPTPSTVAWLYHVGGSLTGTSTLTPPPTPPDLFQYSIDQDVFGDDGLIEHCFGFDIPDPPRPVAAPFGGPGNAIAYLWGITPATAIVLAPGETRELVTHVYAYIDYPVTCSASAPAVTECTGARTAAPLDGSASAASDGTPLKFTWTADDPAVTFDDPSLPRPTAFVPGPGTWTVRLLTEVGPYSGDASVTFDVVDTARPRLDVPALVEARTSSSVPSACGAPVTIRAVAEDDCADAASLVVSNDHDAGGAVASGSFGLGDTVVTFTAADPSGNAATAQALVRVVDDVPPTIVTAGAEPSVLWPPNHRMVEVRVAPSVVDDCDPAPRARITSVVSSERADDRGDGRTATDAWIAPDGTRAWLRAERDGGGSGRTYTLAFEVVDASGNVATATAEVVVPRDRRIRR